MENNLKDFVLVAFTKMLDDDKISAMIKNYIMEEDKNIKENIFKEIATYYIKNFDDDIQSKRQFKLQYLNGYKSN